VIFHLWAMWPDLLFRVGVPHYHWMDWLSLGHVSSHYLPGGDTSWLVLALLGAGGYAALLARWVSARSTEAAAGLSPALGVGGAGVLRPQADPRTEPLAHERLGPAEPTDLAPVLLLHGLGATSATWVAAGRVLAGAGHRVVIPDLLGFGSSLRIGTRFHLQDQVDAVLHLLDRHEIREAHVAAHSWGCAVAGALVERAPHRVIGLTLVAPAAFADPATARERFIERSWLARMTLNDSGIGGLVCGAMCLVRPGLTRLAPRAEPDIPADVARGGVQHSYPAYRDALFSMWEGNPLPSLLRAPPRPVTVVLANSDETVHPSDLLDLGLSDQVQVVRVDGTHALPYDEPDKTAALVLEFLEPSRRIEPRAGRTSR
jgi:pimeloyl-ACP methyl ester carboxylesterase